MEALRIVASRGADGQYAFESYDASDLFKHGTAALEAGECDKAVQHYDRIHSEFKESRYLSPALYNAGLCLAQNDQPEQALERFAALLGELPDSPDVKHASFQAGHLEVELQRFADARAKGDLLLARTDLDEGERIEAMAIRAQALLGLGERVEAERQARSALRYYRSRPDHLVPDEYFPAAINFTLAEALRQKGEELTFPSDDQAEQKKVLVRKAELLLAAQNEYTNTIRMTMEDFSQVDPASGRWAVAAGARIGAQYQKLWDDLMAAPVPSSLSDGAKEVYPQELAKLIKPLLRHAVRYWELTLMMVDRTGIRTNWADETRADLARTRALLLEQPPGPGGLPPEVVKKAHEGRIVPPATGRADRSIQAPNTDAASPQEKQGKTLPTAP